MIVFWPSPVDKPLDGTLLELFKWLRRHGVPWWFPLYRTVEFGSNILLFVPFGVVLALRFAHRFWWLAVVLAAATSTAIELTQAWVLPDRVADWHDIVANTSGALLGAVCVVALRRRLARKAGRDRQKAQDQALPAVE